MRRWFRLVSWTAGGLILVVVALLVAVQTPPARRYLLHRATELLAAQGITFSAGGFDYSLLAMSGVLQSVTVRSPQAPDLPPLLLADRVRVALGFRKLLAGSYHIDDGEVVSPRLNLVVDENGRDNIPHPPKSGSPSSSVSFLIDRFRISGGLLRYEDRRQKLIAEIPLQHIDIDGNELTSNHDVRLTTRPGGFVALDIRKVNLEVLNADVQLEKLDALQIRRLQLNVPGATTQFAGRVDNFNDPRLDVKGDLALDLEPLAKLAGLNQNLRGNVSVSLDAAGTLAQIKASAKIQTGQLALDGMEGIALSADTAYDATTSRVTLRFFEVRSPQGVAQGSGDLALTAQAGESTANVRTDGIDLAQVSTLLRLPVKILSSASANLSARWPGLTWERATGGGNVRLRATGANSLNAISANGSLNLQAAGNRLTIDIAELGVWSANIQGQVSSVDRQQLIGALNLTVPDVAATLASAEIFLGKARGTLLGTPVQGSLSASGTLAGTVSQPSAMVKLRSPDLSVGELSGIGLEASAAFQQNVLELQQASATWRAQEVRASGTVGLAESDPALNLTVSATKVSIESALRAADRGSIEATGIANIVVAISGTAARPDVSVQATGRDLVAYKEPIGNLDLKGRFRDALAELSSLTVQKPDGGSLVASGSYQTDTHQYTIKAQGSNLTLTALTLPDTDPVRARIQTLQADGQGTVEDPALNVHVLVSDILIKDQQLGSIDLTARGANRQVDLQAIAAKFGLDAKATIGSQAPYPAMFEITARDTDLANLPSVPDQLKGTVSAVVRGTGPLQEMAKASVDADASSVKLAWQGEPIQNDGAIQAHYENQVVTVSQATLVAAGSRMTLKGTVPLEETLPEGALELDARVDLASLPKYLPPEPGITAQGMLTIGGSIRGTLKRIAPDLAIAMEGAQFTATQMPFPVTNTTLHARIKDGAIALEKASATLGPASLEASGTIPLGLIPATLPVEIPRQEGPAQFHADLKQLDLSTLGLPEGVKGTVSVQLEGSASRPAIEAITGTITFPELRLSLATYELQQQGTSRVAVNNGSLHIEQFDLTGPTTQFKVSGTADLMGQRAVNLLVDGNMNAAVATVFTDKLRASGPLEIHGAVTGTLTEPQATGYVQLSDAQVSIDSPRLGISNLNLRTEFSATSATISRLEGDLNGGSLTGRGTIAWGGGRLEGTDVTVEATGVYVDYPQGLKTISDISLRAASVVGRIKLTGDVNITGGGFTDDLNLDQGVLAALTSSSELEETKDRNLLLESIDLAIKVRTVNPLVIDNNLAKLELTADARIIGTLYETGMGGQLEIVEGGEIRLQERRYQVERGVIYLVNDRKIEPSLDIAATTTVTGYDIRLQIQGSPGSTDTTLTSDPSLPEPDILALLVTGKSMDEVRGEEFQVARNQVLSYLAGRVGSTVGGQIQRATGLSTVRLEPTFIAAEADPSARLTVGQNLSRNLNFVYSLNLVDSSDQIWTAEYDLTRRFNGRVVRQSDGSFRLDFRHDVRFGGTQEPRRGAQRMPVKIGNINLAGNQTIPEEELRKKLKVKAGDKYDFFKLRNGLEKIQDLYAKQNWMEAAVRLRRAQHDNTVDLTLDVQQGPKVEFVFEGADPPGSVRDRVREIWQAGVFDGQRSEDAVLALRDWMIDDGRMQGKVETTITPRSDNSKRVLFEIQPGPKFDDVELSFDGVSPSQQAELRKVVRSQKLSTEVYTKPGRVTDLLARFYHEQGYLDAEVRAPQYQLDVDRKTGRVVFPVTEGPRYKVGAVAFEGNTVFTQERLARVVPMPTGEFYKPVLRQNALERLRELYYQRGYNDVTSDFKTRRDSITGTLDITFAIIEGPKSVVKDIVITGNKETTESLVRTQVNLKPGDPVEFQKLGQSRRNLYDTGAFATVEIVREPIQDQGDADSKEVLTRLRVAVREIQPFQFRYGAFYDTDRGPGAILDFSNRNTLGSARVVGFRARYDQQLTDSRVYFSQPTLKHFPLKTIAGPYLRYERNPGTVDTDAFNVDRYGFLAQQEARLRSNYVFNYGYRFERSRTYDPGPDPFFDVPLKIARLTSTASRDTRDDVLDATRGSFMSHAVEYSTPKVGSDLSFIKYFGQYFRYQPLQRPRIELFTNKIVRPRLVYAGGIRVGLARGFGGQEVPRSERFFAGGGTTIRGFEQNTVGPIQGRQALGGQAAFILNNELRFPLVGIVDGAGFVDIGNVYESVSKFSLADVRKVAGTGIRVRTSWFLLRADYGVKLDRKAGESWGRFFFSIGQAF